MTTGRWVVLVCGLLLAAGCTIQPAGRRTQSAYIQREVSPAFSTVVSADQLGDDWQDNGCWQMVTDLYATPSADRALLLRRGSQPLWIEGGQIHRLTNDPPICYADSARNIAYWIERSVPDADRLFACDVPSWLWSEVVESSPGDQPAARIADVGGHPSSGSVWLAYLPYSPSTSAPVTIGELSSGGAYTKLHELHADGLSASTPVLVPLAGGALLVLLGDSIWYIDASDRSAQKIYSVPTGRDSQLVADIADPDTAWLLVEPQRGGAGTAREAPGEESGYIVALNTHGAELARISTGSVRFTGIYGDWQNRRALLLHPSIGVALANAQTGELSWLLRQSGAAQLQLLPGGQVWAFVPDGIIGIEGDDLIRLAPKLAAGEVLTRDQLAQVKPVAEALRWRWDDVQLSPLVHEAGHLTFFNAGEVDADWAEFDWALSRELVSRLLIARRPEAADLKLLGLSDAQLDEQVLAMLTVLGWPAAARDPGRGTQSAEELNAFFSLAPEGEANGEAGEFQLWITSGATMLRLTADGPTAQEIPADDAGGESAQ